MDLSRNDQPPQTRDELSIVTISTMIAIGFLIVLTVLFVATHRGAGAPAAPAKAHAATPARPAGVVGYVGLVTAADAHHVVLRTRDGRSVTFLVSAKFPVDIKHLVEEHIPQRTVTTVRYRMQGRQLVITGYEG